MTKKRPPVSRRVFLSFGHNLRAARVAAGLTQADLAQRLDFQRATAISLWERSTHVPEPKTIRKIAAAIGCSTAALLHNVATEYDLLRNQRFVLTRDELRLLEAQTLSDDDRTLLDLWHQLAPLTQQKFRSLFEHMVFEQAGVPDGRVLATRPALLRASSGASRRAAAARPRQRAG